MKQKIAVTVDAVVFKIKENETEVLLIKRKNDPFKTKWAIPGGFLEENEDLASGAKRELQEETGLVVEDLYQLKTYGAVDRDPRGRTISTAFASIISQDSEIKGADDAEEAKWFKLNDLPSLAFDHLEILEDAKAWLITQKA